MLFRSYWGATYSPKDIIVPPERAAALGYMDDVVVEIADRKCIQTLDVFQALGDGGRQRLDLQLPERGVICMNS